MASAKIIIAIGIAFVVISVVLFIVGIVYSKVHGRKLRAELNNEYFLEDRL